MLVLSRRVGQQIRIGDSIVVTLLKVDRNKARIGIEAPSNVPVYRQELLDFDKRPGSGSSLRASAGDESARNRRNFPLTTPRLLWEPSMV